ncbi:MAG: LAGLIDADG family homing endonuclease, partial [Nanoarchaeota archaeon]
GVYLEKWSGLKVRYKINKEGLHQINLYSVDACRIVNNFDLNEIPKLDRELQFIFLRGLFDSDGGVIGKNLNFRKEAKRWIHFSNNNALLIKIVRVIFDDMKIKYSISKRIHSGFGSKKWQYEIKIYNLKGIFKYYKNIGFSIKRKQEKLKEVIDSYQHYSYKTFKKAQELHKKMGFRKVAKALNINPGIVYGWLFKDNTKQILDIDVE